MKFLKFLKKRRVKICLFFICLLGLVLRVWQINQAPPSLNWDEVSHGYNAYSILKTGQDEWGVSWPTIFRAYGDYKLPVYIYLTAASEALFGLNSFAVRFPSVLAGFLSILFTYLLVKKLFKKDAPALLAAFFLAVSPWHLFLSRPAFEANLASFLVISGLYFFLRGLERRWFLSLAVFFLGLSVHTYNSARIFVPLILITLLVLYRSSFKQWLKKRKKEAFLSLLIAALFFIPLIVSFVSPTGWARFKWVSILDQGAINRINMARAASTLPAPWPRLIHNKATSFALTFSKNYLANLSPGYLFFKGSSNYQYNLPQQGVIYWLDLPLVLLGLFWLFKNWRQREAKLILFWWLLAIVPAAATRDNPHVLRTILVLPMPQVLMALGIWQLFLWLKRRWRQWLVVLVYLIILAFLVGSWLNNYFGPYRRNYSWAWQYGYQQAADFIKEHGDEYQQIWLTKKYGEPHEFLLFYLKWDPAKYRQAPNLKRYFQSDWYWVDSFDKFVFVNDWEVKEKLTARDNQLKRLLITSPGNYPEGWVKIETINFLDGQPAFEILEQ